MERAGCKHWVPQNAASSASGSASFSPDGQKENFPPKCKMNDEGFLGCSMSARSRWASPDRFLPHLRASHALETGARQETIRSRETGRAGGGCLAKLCFFRIHIDGSHVPMLAHRPVLQRPWD